MAGLLSDARKTAMGAGALVLLALWFTDQGGVGGEAVVAADAAGYAPRHQSDEAPVPKASPSPTPAPPGWSAEEVDDGVEPAPTQEGVLVPDETETPPE